MLIAAVKEGEYVGATLMRSGSKEELSIGGCDHRPLRGAPCPRGRWWWSGVALVVNHKKWVLMPSITQRGNQLPKAVRVFTARAVLNTLRAYLPPINRLNVLTPRSRYRPRQLQVKSESRELAPVFITAPSIPHCALFTTLPRHNLNSFLIYWHLALAVSTIHQNTALY